jgi:hypothetical protein
MNAKDPATTAPGCDDRLPPSSHPLKLALLRLALSAACSLASAVAANVFRVDANSTNPVPPYAEWTTAAASVQEGIDAVGGEGEIWVAAGTYFENLILPAGIRLYGGFTGVETNRNQRNWTTHLTILDGRRSNSVVVVTGGETNTTRIDGFVIRNGKAFSGGGILCYLASPSIANNFIIQNHADETGGGVFCWNASPEIAFNLIQDNNAGEAGGGVFFGMDDGVSAADIHHNRIVGNSVVAAVGGGLFCRGGGGSRIYDNLIAANAITGGYGSGAGLYIDGLIGTNACFVVNNTIAWNRAPAATSGAGIYCTLVPTTVANNIIAFGSSGLYVFNRTLLRSNCVYGNQFSDFGGAYDPLTNNISADPQLSPMPSSSLLSTSPCIDAGDPALVPPGSVDIKGSPRVVGAGVDMGADEFDGATPAVVAAIVRVSPAGDDANDGSSWAQAKRTVQAALDQPALNGSEVWVQTGVYSENLVLRHFSYLYGGFSGVETSRSARDWRSHPTVLDGAQRGSVITASNLQQWNAIDGFEIRNGRAACGGGIFCAGSAPVIANDRIVENTATNFSGGGIYCESGANPTLVCVITNNVISSNAAAAGGGVYLTNALALVANNWFEANQAVTSLRHVGGVPKGGGGVYVWFNSAPIIQNNFFLNNIATNEFDSPVWSSGGAIHLRSPSAQVTGNTFLGNLASGSVAGYPENGGGLAWYAAPAIVANNLIAFGSSGLISYFDLGRTNYRNNCVFGNTTNYTIASDPTGTNGNISVDPLVAAPGDYHLGPDSPCINAGDNGCVDSATTDLDGQPRVAGGTVDIGAHEFQMPASLISYAWLQYYGLPWDGSADSADVDGDRLNAWEEWRAGTDPTNGLSVLRMVAVSNSGSGLTVTWQSVSGVQYYLQRSALAGGTPFTTIRSNLTGQVNQTSCLDSNAVGAGPYYYRVGAE